MHKDELYAILLYTCYSYGFEIEFMIDIEKHLQ